MTEKKLIYQLAEKRVQNRQNFYIHLTVFTLGSLVLFLVNWFLIDTHTPWFIIPVGIWGLLVLVHLVVMLSTQNSLPTFSKNWKKKAIENEVRKLEHQYGVNIVQDLSEIEEELELRRLNRIENKWDDNELV